MTVSWYCAWIRALRLQIAGSVTIVRRSLFAFLMEATEVVTIVVLIQAVSLGIFVG
tara:strand:+ start:179 stop:346 length:168 start_codon:yes stop_codon:yes gene_type:complete